MITIVTKDVVFLCLAAALIRGGIAFAAPVPSVSDSWDSIRAMPGIWIGSGTFYDAEMGGIFNICTDGSNLRTIHPIQDCLAYHAEHEGSAGRGGADAICLKTGTREIVHSLRQRMNICVRAKRSGSAGRGDSSCERYGVATSVIPTTVNLEVGVQSYTNGAYPMNMSYQLFFKPYTIPSCE